MFNKEKYLKIIDESKPIKEIGRVIQVIGLIIESEGPQASIGDLCYIYPTDDSEPIWSEVVGFKQSEDNRADKIQLMPLGKMEGIQQQK